MGFCPECGSEFREGFTQCKDCGVPLVPDLPPDFQETKLERRKLTEHFGAKDWHLPEIDASERMRFIAWLLVSFLIGYYLILVVHSEYSSLINRGETTKSVVDWIAAIVSGVSLDTLLIVSFLLLAILLAIVDTERRLSIIRTTQYLAFLYASLYAVTFILRFFTSWFDFYSINLFESVLGWLMDLLMILALFAVAFLSMKYLKRLSMEESDE